MDATADKDNPSALSHQPSARTEASVAEYLFYHCDHLGTVRLITNNSGAVVSRHDYEPFGVEIAPVVETANNTHRFTGHERDASTGYDYMHYRSYGSNLGRFMKPDNITGNPLNPQSWNLYSYVRGNPVNFNDPTGHKEKEGEKGKTTSSSSDANMENPTSKANEKKEQEQPKKVGVKIEENASQEKAISDETKIGAVATAGSVTTDAVEKVASKKMPTQSVALAKKLMVEGGTKGKMLPVVGTSCGIVGAAMDVPTIGKNVFVGKGMGTGMTKEELNDTLLQIGINLVGIGVSAALFPETAGASAIPLYINAAALGTNIGKLANAYFDPSAPAPAHQDVHWPGPY